MTASLETLVVAAYIFADEQAFPRRGPKGEITDAELVALAVAQAAMGVPSDRQFLGLVGKVLPGWFPHLPSQSQYNRRLRRLAPVLAAVQLRVAELIARSELRHDAAVVPMQRDLREQTVSQQPLVGVEHGKARVVAGSFNTENTADRVFAHIRGDLAAGPRVYKSGRSR